MKTKKALYNYISESLPEILIIVLSLIRIKFFLTYLGTEISGVYQVYGQIFGYLTLSEAGFTTACLYALYKPIANKNRKKISEILSGSNFIFKIIALFMIVIGIGLSFFIAFFIKDCSLTDKYLQITFLLFLILNVLNYFYTPYLLIYDAEGKRYVPNLIRQIGLIIKIVIEIVLIYLKCDLIVILLVSIAVILLTNIILKIKVKKDYSDLQFNGKKDFSMWKNTKELIFHKIGGVVASNIDILLISKYIGLSQVVMYSAYNYILNALLKLISKISDSLQSLIGVNIEESSNENNYQIFLEYNSIVHFIAIIIGSSLIFAFTPFINIYFGSDVTAPRIIMMLFVFITYYKISHLAFGTFVTSAGLFKETKKCTILEAIINLSLSLILLKFWGIKGILLATIISYITTDFLMRPIIVHKKLFKLSSKKFYQECMMFFTMFILLTPINLLIFPQIFKMNNLLLWFLFSIIVFVFNTLLTFLYFKLIKKINWFDRIIKILKRRNKNV